MELFYAPMTGEEIGRPFILNAQMQWIVEVNHFLRDVAIIDGNTSSPFTRRTYAYQLLDWLNFCERVALNWKHVKEIDIAAYRNALLTTPSPLTGKLLLRGTIKGKVGTVCQFYQFLLRKGYIVRLPFSFKEVSRSYRIDSDPLAHIRASTKTRLFNQVNLRTYDRQIEIPTNNDIGLFIRTFKNWRDRLIAEIMWMTGMRRREVCQLSIHILPEGPMSVATSIIKIKIIGKGNKRRWIDMPVRLLRSIARYIELIRNPRVKKYRVKTDRIWVGVKGSPIGPATINKSFTMNSRSCGLKINPHDLRHSFAVNRLLYLEERQVKGALKIVQMELGHEHFTTTQQYIHLTEKMRAEVIATHSDFIDRLLAYLEPDEEE